MSQLPKAFFKEMPDYYSLINEKEILTKEEIEKNTQRLIKKINNSNGRIKE